LVARLAVLLSALATAALGFAPAHVVHRMVGRALPNMAVAESVVSMRLDCVFYEEGPTCTGRWQCKPAPGDRRMPSASCPREKGAVVLEMGPQTRSDDLSHDASFSLEFSNGTGCSFRGTVPFSFGEVPAMAGRYECFDAAGLGIEQGLFGIRAREIGKPFHRFD
jgi:hypothetical protein